MAEVFDWLAPVPFWEPEGSEGGAAMIRPALLEFASDTFLNDFLAEATSGKMLDWDALQRRTLPYRSASEAPADDTALPGTIPANLSVPLKLFQPAHQRFYLLCASLCCREPGFPDRTVRRAEGESAFYVLRKLDKANHEYAWVIEGESKSWKLVPGNGKSLLPGEERQPLFATSTCCQRSLQYGYVAVASRDTYTAELPVANASPAEERLQRLAQLDENIIAPLAQRLENGIPTRILPEFSFYLLSDLADYLDAYLKPVADAIRNDVTLPAGVNKDLLDTLKWATITSVLNTTTWYTALKQIYQKLPDLAFAIGVGGSRQIVAVTLRSRIEAALPTPSPSELAGMGMRKTRLPKLTADDGEQFLIRCVYERPCDAPFPPRQIVSEPTHPFRLAAFFDTDAPARPIKIELPADVGIGAMRKFRKGVSFLASDAMRNKMSMATKGLLKDTAGSEGNWTLGMLCSFSIQIIFIVAFFLLLIFVIVFNLIFWWLPFFRICLPIPKKGNG